MSQLQNQLHEYLETCRIQSESAYLVTVDYYIGKNQLTQINAIADKYISSLLENPHQKQIKMHESPTTDLKQSNSQNSTQTQSEHKHQSIQNSFHNNYLVFQASFQFYSCLSFINHEKIQIYPGSNQSLKMKSNKQSNPQLLKLYKTCTFVTFKGILKLELDWASLDNFEFLTTMDFPNLQQLHAGSENLVTNFKPLAKINLPKGFKTIVLTGKVFKNLANVFKTFKRGNLLRSLYLFTYEDSKHNKVNFDDHSFLAKICLPKIYDIKIYHESKWNLNEENKLSEFTRPKQKFPSIRKYLNKSFD